MFPFLLLHQVQAVIQGRVTKWLNMQWQEKNVFQGHGGKARFRATVKSTAVLTTPQFKDFRHTTPLKKGTPIWHNSSGSLYSIFIGYLICICTILFFFNLLK